MPSRSRPDANASPTRRIVSSSSLRLRWTSSIFDASCSDMRLNSVPSAANSSPPSTGTGREKSPAARRRAAARNCSIWRCSARTTTTDESSASSRNATRIAPISARESSTADWMSAPGTNTPIDTPGPTASSTAAKRPRYSCPATSTSPDSILGGPRSGIVEASSRPLRTTRTSRDVRRATWRAYASASAIDTATAPSRSPSAVAGRATAGAIASGSPTNASRRPAVS